MDRIVGTKVSGLRAPIIRRGDDLAQMVTDTALQYLSSEGLTMADRDIVALTESIVARAQGNYASVGDIAEDVRKKTGGKKCGVIFPILSRNRFAILLKGMARGLEEIVLMLSYPSDEVGNHLISLDALDASGINPWRDVLDEEQFRAAFGTIQHPFTHVDYIQYYRSIIEGEGCRCTLRFANAPEAVLSFTDCVIHCDIHSRKRTRRLLEKAGARCILSLQDLLSQVSLHHGYNEEYGLLGSNKSTEEEVKLFPRDCDLLVRDIQQRLEAATGARPEVLVYGDGAFKDPVGQIWELADPVVSPGYTDGLEGTPNEVKIKYLADNDFRELSGEALNHAIADYIAQKNPDLRGEMVSQGTTPRRLTDLIGSLCDLTSGSGDKGTPIVYISGYFDNFSK
ncbi:hypothetical protein ABB02_00170 [Clostridiaceae bacterium JG1575]|nr:hypothetical protein ABB02_00170 [Clostridiaceae bacterium JG1575]